MKRFYERITWVFRIWSRTYFRQYFEFRSRSRTKRRLRALRVPVERAFAAERVSAEQAFVAEREPAAFAEQALAAWGEPAANKQAAERALAGSDIADWELAD